MAWSTTRGATPASSEREELRGRDLRSEEQDRHRPLGDVHHPEPMGENLYSLMEKVKTDKLSLITLSRFSREKGFERMLIMAEKIKYLDYTWNIYGDLSTGYAKSIIPKLKKYKQINICGITNKPLEQIVKHDYLVQLSDTEGFPYSVYESLQCLTPVISTDYPSVHELIKNGKNGYIFDMELSNFDVDIIKQVPKITTFKEKSTEKDWFKFLKEIL